MFILLLLSLLLEETESDESVSLDNDDDLLNVFWCVKWIFECEYEWFLKRKGLCYES